MFEGGIVTAAVWRDIDALTGFRPTGGGGSMILLVVLHLHGISGGTRRVHQRLLCVSGYMALFLREDWHIYDVDSWMATSLPSDVSEAAIHTYQTYSILDLTILL